MYLYNHIRMQAFLCLYSLRVNMKVVTHRCLTTDAVVNESF